MAHQRFEAELAGRTITVETGHVAEQLQVLGAWNRHEILVDERIQIRILISSPIRSGVLVCRHGR